MGFKETIHCEECDAQKKGANHWFTAGVHPHLGITLNRFEASQKDKELLRVLFLYCGQSCLNTAVQRWMDTGHLEKQDAEVSAEVAVAD
jgi:hypothetical protein